MNGAEVWSGWPGSFEDVWTHDSCAGRQSFMTVWLWGTRCGEWSREAVWSPWELAWLWDWVSGARGWPGVCPGGREAAHSCHPVRACDGWGFVCPREGLWP